MAINFLDGISVDGSVGIGTTSPGAKLHIRDTSASTSTVKMSAASNNANYAYLKMTDNTVNTAKLTLGTTYGYSTDKDTITLFNGDVGIGTTSPDSKLEVASTVNATYLHVRNDGAGSTRLKMSNSSDTNSNGFQIINNAFNGQVNLLNYKASTLALWTNGSEKMTILSGGNVGIGTTTPVAKLQVNGTFTSTGVSNIGSSADTSVYLTASSGTGKVGVGTASPTEKLDVNGNVKASGYKTSSGTGVTTNVTVRNQNNSGTRTFQIVGGIIVGIT